MWKIGNSEIYSLFPKVLSLICYLRTSKQTLVTYLAWSQPRQDWPLEQLLMSTAFLLSYTAENDSDLTLTAWAVFIATNLWFPSFPHTYPNARWSVISFAMYEISWTAWWCCSSYKKNTQNTVRILHQNVLLKSCKISVSSVPYLDLNTHIELKQKT